MWLHQLLPVLRQHRHLISASAVEISGHRTRAVFDRYNIVSGRDLDDAMAKRAAYEVEMSKGRARSNVSKEPVPFPSAAPLAK
jgi:hypothetical protein